MRTSATNRRLRLLLTQLIRVFGTVEDLQLPDTSRAWKKADLFTLLVEVHRAIYKRHLHVEILAVRERLLHFYETVDRIENVDEAEDEVSARYHRAALQATNDRGNRIVRGEIVQTVLDPTYRLTWPETSGRGA